MILASKPSHAIAMNALGLRQADIDEWVGGVGGEVLPAMLRALEVPGSINQTYVHRGVPLAMWGSYALGPEWRGGGQVWFIATNLAMKQTVSIHHWARHQLKDMHKRFEWLVAYTHPRNVLHHKWLERHGFKKLGDPIITATGIPYLAYIHERGA